jgi:hypothetical protein
MQTMPVRIIDGKADAWRCIIPGKALTLIEKFILII